MKVTYLYASFIFEKHVLRFCTCTTCHLLNCNSCNVYLKLCFQGPKKINLGNCKNFNLPLKNLNATILEMIRFKGLRF